MSQPSYRRIFNVTNILLTSKPYSKAQLEFHQHIDNINSLMNKPICHVPQIQYGRFQDVSKEIKKIGTFFNHHKKNYIFKDSVYKKDIQGKLIRLKLLFDKFIVRKLSDNIFSTYDYDLLKGYIIAAIHVIEKHPQM